MMHFSPRHDFSKDTYASLTLNTLLSKVPFSKESPIHSSQKRQDALSPTNAFGTLRKGQLHNSKAKPQSGSEKRVISSLHTISQANSTPDGLLDLQIQQKEQRQSKNGSVNKIKDMWITIEDQHAAIGIRPNSVLLHSRPQTTVNSQDIKLANYSLIRPKSNGGMLYGNGHKQTQSLTYNNNSTNQSRPNTVTPTLKSFMKGKNAPSKDITAMSVMLDTQGANHGDFADDHIMEKHQNIKLIKAPHKERLHGSTFKLTDFDIKLIPSDARRIMFEALMRDYLLSLIPENSDFFIYKNAQTNVYNIMFTGGLLPVCRTCSTVVRMEVSQIYGFRVLCGSDYCKTQVLYKKPLSDYVINTLWPKEPRPDIEPSVQVKQKTSSKSISMQIQNGRYKTKNFKQAFNMDTAGSPRLNLDYNIPTNFVHARPNTTSNGNRTRLFSPKAGFKRIMIRSGVNTEADERPAKPYVNARVHTEEFRPATSELRVRRGVNLELDEFRGEPLLQGLGSEGLYKAEDKVEKKPKDIIREDVKAENEQEKLALEEKLNEIAGKGKLDVEELKGEKEIGENGLGEGEHEKIHTQEGLEHSLDEINELNEMVGMMSHKENN